MYNFVNSFWLKTTWDTGKGSLKKVGISQQPCRATSPTPKPGYWNDATDPGDPYLDFRDTADQSYILHPRLPPH